MIDLFPLTIRARGSLPCSIMAYRIFVVDGQPLIRRGYDALLASEPDLTMCGEASTAEDALDPIAACAPDLVLTDIALPGVNGIEFTKRLHAIMPSLPVVIVSNYDELLYAERALRAGARGYIMKREVDVVIVEALRRVLAGGIFLSEAMRNLLLLQFARRGKRPEASPVERLSDRELEVFEMFGRGLTTRAVAEALHISPKTVESHRGRIKEKMDVATTAELVKRSVIWVQNKGA
jgi:DNA-binding NarL/FixJ family response regulator